MRPLLPALLLATLAQLATSALADKPRKTGGGMYSIQWISGSYQEIDEKSKPKGAVIPITETPRGTSACHLDATPSAKPVNRWFISTVSEEKKISINHSWSEPKDESYCAIGVVANLHIAFDHPGEYKFTTKVHFTKYNP